MNNTTVIKSKSEQVAEVVNEWLRSGKFKIGDKLPSERKLAELLGVSLLTVNKAMSKLEDIGLVSRMTGRGTHVTGEAPVQSIAVLCDSCHLSNSKNTAFTNLLIDQLLLEAKNSGVVPHFIVGRGKTGEDFADSLGLQSPIWSNIKGVISRGWRKGVEELLNQRGVEVVTISSKDQGINQIILNYQQLGEMASEYFLKNNVSNCFIVHQSVFSELEFNNPVLGFTASYNQSGSNTVNTLAVDIDEIDQGIEDVFLKDLDRILNSDSDGIFFTNENLAALFFKKIEPLPNHNEILSRFTIATHATSGFDWGFPQGVHQLVFDVKDICQASLNLLESLIKHQTIPGVRKFVKAKSVL